MFIRCFPIRCMTAVVTLMTAVGQVGAVSTQVIHQDSLNCDPLIVPNQVDEIGDFNIFPTGEELEALPLSQGPVVCSQSNTGLADLVVEIINRTNKTFEEVWYVANPDTDITNYDGFVNDSGFGVGPNRHEAFRIDRLLTDPGGSHHPLIAEINGTQDGKWEPGESWQFVLQDYVNTSGLSHADINSIGVGDASPAVGIIPSSGSIIAIVPEPATCMLMVLGFVGCLGRRTRL